MDLRTVNGVAKRIINFCKEKNELPWLEDNTFVMWGALEEIALKKYEKLDEETIDTIDRAIESYMKELG